MKEHFTQKIDNYNNAIKGVGEAGELISLNSVEDVIEHLPNPFRDSVLDNITDSAESISIDSQEYEVKMARRKEKMIVLQRVWLIFLTITVSLTILQGLLAFFNKQRF